MNKFGNLLLSAALAEHADDPSWQPVILFAVALPRDGSPFGTDLVRAILKQTPLKAPGKGRSSEARQKAAEIRRRQFFFFRCFTNAYQLNDRDITAAFEQLSTDLLPPQNMTDAEALAACGDSVVPYLTRQDGWTAAQRAACVRALGLLGGPRAKRCLQGYANDSANAVREQLSRAVGNPIEFPAVVAHLEEHGCFPAWVSPSSLSGLRGPQTGDSSRPNSALLGDLAGFFAKVVTRAIEEEMAVKDRHTLAVALGWLGDPRVTVDLRLRTQSDGHPGYVEIAAGDYYFSEDKTRSVIKEPIWLSKYPVTNSQFALFLEDEGYARAEFWSAEGWQYVLSEGVKAPACWRDPQFNAPNQPVVGVSWWEAEAFCRWAGGFLPTEQQWEAAARGRQGYVYPWGNEWKAGICNSGETDLGTTSAVGIFPRNCSPFGVMDMAGNVWEWCSDLWMSGAGYRVFRGGGWAVGAECCRSAHRCCVEPAYRYVHLGFRVAAVPPGSGRAPATGQAEPVA